MAYAAWSVSFGEQPSTAKWNMLGTNDASFNNGTGIANLALSTTSISNPYKFYAYASSAYNWGTNTWAKVALNAELYDTNGNFDTTNYRYTAPVNGYYFITSMARTSSAVGGNLYGIQLWVNGSVANGLSGLQAIQGAGTSGFGAPVSGLLQLNAGDYVEIAAYGTGNTGVPGRYETYLMGFLVSQS